MGGFSDAVEAILHWLQPGADTLLPYAPLLLPLVGFLAALAAIATVRQRTRADASDEWWKRVQFALSKSESDSLKTQAIGTKMLDHLTDSSRISYKPWTWRSRWRVTSRDLEMISSVLEFDTFPGHEAKANLDAEDLEADDVNNEPTADSPRREPEDHFADEGKRRGSGAAGATDEGSTDREARQENRQEDS